MYDNDIAQVFHLISLCTSCVSSLAFFKYLWQHQCLYPWENRYSIKILHLKCMFNVVQVFSNQENRIKCLFFRCYIPLDYLLC